MEWNDDGDEFCIMDENRPDWSLCGQHIPDKADVDNDEVPEEITCQECLAIQITRDTP